MTEKEMIEMLDEDISRLRLPPISEKVFKALEEKRVKYIEAQNLSIHNTVHKIIPRAYIFVAMLMLVVISVPIIVVMTNHSPISDLPNAPVLPGSSETVSVTESQIVTSTEEPKTALEQIKLKQTYGEVALSGKSEEELEMLLVTYSENNNVYEDDRNIYNFDSQGRLIEMRKADLGDEEGQPVDEQAIAARVNALLKEYYPDWSENECDIRIEKNEDSRPAWTVYVIKNNDDLYNEVITLTFDKSGVLQVAVINGSSTNFGIISKAEAVEIVLQELRNGKYKLQTFENKDVEITVNNKTIDNKQYYEVNVDKIPYARVNGEVYFAGYLFLVDSETGEFSTVDYST